MISPILLKLGPITLRWYGLMAALGTLAFFGLMSIRARKYAIKPNYVSDLMLIIIFCSILGARLFYVVRFWHTDFAHRPLTAVFKVWEGGLVFQGGFIVTALAVVFYAFYRKIPIGSLGDLIAPALPLGHALGRIGCYINGCCYGFAPYEGFLAAHYPFSPEGRFPVQLVESAGNVILCLALLLIEKKQIANQKRFLLYLMGYTVLRFCNEPLRGDYPLDQKWCGMTPGQYHALWQFPLVLAIFLAITWWNKRNKKK